MTSGKFLHRFKLSFPCAAIVCALLAPSSHAQTGTQQQAQPPVYVPPPMFDDTPAVMVRPKTDNGYIVEPKISAKPAAPATPVEAPRPPVITPRVSVDPDSGRAPGRPITRPQTARPVKPATPAPVKPAAPKTPSLVIEPTKAPTPPAKKPDMMKPIVEKKPSEKSEKEVYIKRDKPKAAAPEETNQQDVRETKAPPPPSADDNAPMPAARVKHGGSVVTGPKTMPAVPTEDVDNQVLFNGDDDAQSQTILERHQTETRKKRQEENKRIEADKPVPPPVKEDAPSAAAKTKTFEDNGQDAMKRSLPMQPGQISLSPPLAQQTAAAVLEELAMENRKDWRIQIRAYAAPHGAGLNSDKRIALSRALALRSTLITQGVAPDKIDVLADGLENTGDERIDLYLYGPKAR